MAWSKSAKAQAARRRNLIKARAARRKRKAPKSMREYMRQNPNTSPAMRAYIKEETRYSKALKRAAKKAGPRTAPARARRRIKQKSSKRLQGRVARTLGIQEYVTRKGTHTGWATNTAPSRTFGSAMRKGRVASLYNKSLGRKLRRADRRRGINKSIKTYGYKGPA